MFLPRRTLLAPVLICALLTAGCGEVVSTLSDLRAVQNALAIKFGDEVSVNVTQSAHGLMFTVWFVNSPLNAQTPDARQNRAEDAARTVKESYAKIDTVQELWVGFVSKKTRLVVFHSSQIVGMHGFDRNARPLPRRNEPAVVRPENELQVTAAYDSSGDQTDISVSGIQLAGQPGGYGITVLPFFKVPGDVRATRGLAPKTVTLNFASYAQKPKFEQIVPISFVADGKVVHKAEGTFTGNDAQFCYLNVPYPAFRRMVNAKDLVIKLGDTGYPLAPSQLSAMQKMTDYVTK